MQDQRTEPAAPPPAAARAGADTRVAVVATILMLIGMPIGYLTDNPATGDVIGMIVLILISLALMAGLFLRLIPGQLVANAGVNRPARTGLIFGIIGFVTVIVFWTALPFPLGATAIALGLAGRELAPRAGDGGRATAALVLGVLAILLSFVALLVG
jgi:hypothetical protein